MGMLKTIASDFRKAYKHESSVNKAIIWFDFIAAVVDFAIGNWFGGVFMLMLTFWMLTNAIHSLHLDEASSYIKSLEMLVELWRKEADGRLKQIEALKSSKTTKKRKQKAKLSKSRKTARKTARKTKGKTEIL